MYMEDGVAEFGQLSLLKWKHSERQTGQRGQSIISLLKEKDERENNSVLI